MEKFIVPSTFSDSHRYKSEKGVISLLYPHKYTMNMYEIFCIEGELFEGTERYETLSEAEERISELLK